MLDAQQNVLPYLFEARKRGVSSTWATAAGAFSFAKSCRPSGRGGYRLDLYRSAHWKHEQRMKDMLK